MSYLIDDTPMPWCIECFAVSKKDCSCEKKTYQFGTGKQAYEAELVERPFYHTGEPRKTWDELSDVVRSSWDKNPTIVAT